MAERKARILNLMENYDSDCDSLEGNLRAEGIIL